jgi:hypothetical protein
VQHLERAPTAHDVQLVAGLSIERPAAVGADLRVDAELAQEAERPTGHRVARDVEVNRDLAAAEEVNGARGVEERGELGEAAALAAGRDRRELVADLIRERHAELPSLWGLVAGVRWSV